MKDLLQEAAQEVVNEYNASHIAGTDSPGQTPASAQIPTIRKSEEKKAEETGLQPEEGFSRSSFGLTSNAFPNELKSLVKKELSKLLKQKEKKS